MKVNTKILVTPLNWGLGHATRCIPLINELRRQSYDVHIASDGGSLQLLKEEFPQLHFFELPSYNISYNSHFVWSMAKKIPAIVNAIEAEREAIQNIVTQCGIDVVISDNRYGCYSSKTKNIFLCHQQYLLLPWWMKPVSPFINFLHRRYLNKFHEQWIPDFSNHYLSGILSETALSNVRYIGALSRFKASDSEMYYDIAAVISGPEPQRTFIEQILWSQLQSAPYKSILVCGKISDDRVAVKSRNAEKVNFLNAHELELLLNKSDVVICRSGYSSLMDMISLRKRVIFIPTPGQTEQEYIAQRFQAMKIAPMFTQNDFNIEYAIDVLKDYKGFSKTHDFSTLLAEAVKSI